VTTKSLSGDALLAVWGIHLGKQRQDAEPPITQTDLAERTGLNQGSISRAETGRGASLTTILRMAEGLGISLSELAQVAESSTRAA
jgi:hypothetical protein